VSIDELNIALLVGAGVLMVAVLAVRLSSRAGLPSLLLYLGIGAALSGFGVTFNDLQVAQALGIAALVIILTEGGITTHWDTIRPQLPLALSLSTVGVGVSVVVVAALAHYVLDFPWQLAVLCGAILSSTDAAAIFSTLRRVPLKPRVAGTLEAESGINDAPVIILVLLVIKPGESTSFVSGLGLLVFELVVGALVGCLVGWGGAAVLRRVALPASGLYPIAVTTCAVLAYGAAASLHASGFLAVYLAALILGNGALPHRAVTRGFIEALAWVAQIGLFVVLGLLVVPIADFTWSDLIAPALLIGVVLTFVARPLAVLVAATAFRVAWREQAFLSWAGLRGAVPIVIAILPAAELVDQSRHLLDIVFVLVVVFTLVQSPTLPWAARRLGVAETTEARELTVEVAPLDRVGAELLQVRIPIGSKLHGVEVAELRLPQGALVALVVRDDISVVPSPTTGLRSGDEVLVVVPSRSRAEVQRRLTAVSEHGRLAGWLGRRSSASAAGSVSSAGSRWALVSRWPGHRGRRTPPR
jgi:cell volume regulation protein A